MQQKSSSPDADRPPGLIDSLVNLRVTHRTVSSAGLDQHVVKDQRGTLAHIASSGAVRGVVMLQTCNRIEFYAVRSHGDECATEDAIIGAWAAATGQDREAVDRTCERARGEDAVRHLMGVASGIESQVVGEEQILGQVHEGLSTARSAGTAGDELELVFDTCVKAARRVRARTGVGKGAASVGSIAVDILENMCGGLAGKRIIVIGAGQMGKLVARRLIAKGCTEVTIANRTVERAEKVAGRLGTRNVGLESLDSALTDADGVLVATSAHHHILTRRRLEPIMDGRARPLVIVDISRPRNVEESAGDLAGVRLLDFDHIEMAARAKVPSRAAKVEAAREVIEHELSKFRAMVHRDGVEPLVSAVHCRAESLRRSEAERAKRLLADLLSDKLDRGEREDCDAIVDALSRALVSKVLADPVQRAKEDAERGDPRSAELLVRLFDRCDDRGED